MSRTGKIKNRRASALARKSSKIQINRLRRQVGALRSQVRGLSESVDRPAFNSERRYRERIGREEFFYLTFRALKFNQIDGDYVEFGSHGATTFCFAYHQAKLHRHKARMWAFDSFQGFPEQKDAQDEHPKWIKGMMSTSLEDFHKLCASRNVPREEYKVFPGFFSDVLPNLSQEEAPNNIALAYIDCDLYSSTMDVFDFLKPRFKHGMILAFDDYYCWSDTQASGERVAMLETFANSDKWELIPHLQFGWHGLSFILHDKSLNTTSWQPNW